MSGSNDPFSAAAAIGTPQMPSQQPGMLGVSPSTWESIAALGSGMIAGANQRTADGHLANGTGFAGGFGAGVSAYLGDQRQQAAMRSQLGQRQAETTGINLQNQLSGMQLPFLQQKAQLQQAMMANPQFRQMLMNAMQGVNGGGPMQGGMVPGAFGGGQPNLAPAMHQLESGGQTNTPGIFGDGGAAAGPAQVHQGALTDVNRAQGTNYTLDQLAANPNLGTQVGDMYLRMQQNKFPGRPDLALAAYNAGPGRAQQAASGTQPLPVSTQGYVQRGMNMLDPSWGLNQYQGAMDQAKGLDVLKSMGFPVPGDPQMLRQAGLEFQKFGLSGPQAQAEAAARAGVEMQTAPQIAGAKEAATQAAAFPYAGPKAEAEAAGKANVQLQTGAAVERAKTIGHGVQPTMDRFGNMYQMDGSGQMHFIGRGSEVKQVWNPATGRMEWGEQGGVGVGDLRHLQTGIPGAGGSIDGQGGGGVAAEPGPGEKAGLEGAAKVATNFIEHDNKMIDEDLSHVIENVGPAKQALFQLRDKIDGADTGALGEFRANVRNYVQTFMPAVADQFNINASPAQELQKLQLLNSGKQERGDLGARGGVRAVELYLKANPGMENQPQANHDMANALLISHQYHEDYARGATDFFNNQVAGVQQAGTTKNYQKVSNYDQQFIDKFRPQLYASAISAMNGKPYGEWSKGLTVPQLKIVGGILQRTDPTAHIDLGGRQVPVSAFQQTMAPQDIMGGGGGH